MRVQHIEQRQTWRFDDDDGLYLGRVCMTWRRSREGVSILVVPCGAPVEVVPTWDEALAVLERAAEPRRQK